MAEEEKNVSESAPAEPAKETASAAPKKSNTTLIVVIVVVLVVLIGGGILGNWLMKRASQKAADGLLSSMFGSKVTTDSNSNTVTLKGDDGSSIQVGDTSTWPSDMPSDVPKYSKGKIESALKLNETSSGKSWSVSISGTTQADYDAYLKQIEAAGWTKDASIDFGISSSQYNKGTNSLMVVFDASSKGDQITLTPTS